jgi:hypothetical protein
VGILILSSLQIPLLGEYYFHSVLVPPIKLLQIPPLVSMPPHWAKVSLTECFCQGNPCFSHLGSTLGSVLSSVHSSALHLARAWSFTCCLPDSHSLQSLALTCVMWPGLGSLQIPSVMCYWLVQLWTDKVHQKKPFFIYSQDECMDQ